MSRSSASREVTSDEVRENWTELVENILVEGQRIVIDSPEQGAVALISLADLEWLEEAEDLWDAEDFRRARSQAREEPSKPLEQVIAELGL